MPRMSGLDLLRRCLEIDRELPVIMLTGDSTVDSAVRALKAGAFNYLTKPIPDFDAAAAVLERCPPLASWASTLSGISSGLWVTK